MLLFESVQDGYYFIILAQDPRELLFYTMLGSLILLMIYSLLTDPLSLKYKVYIL